LTYLFLTLFTTAGDSILSE